MPKYTVGKRWWFDELGRKADAGEVVDLPAESAESYMRNEPGLLAPVRETTQGSPAAIRKAGRPRVRAARK